MTKRSRAALQTAWIGLVAAGVLTATVGMLAASLYAEAWIGAGASLILLAIPTHRYLTRDARDY